MRWHFDGCYLRSSRKVLTQMPKNRLVVVRIQCTIPLCVYNTKKYKTCELTRVKITSNNVVVDLIV